MADLEVFVLGRDDVGVVAEDRGSTPPMRYYLTDCCGASAKGMADYVGCRSCYAEVDASLGGLPDGRLDFTDGRVEFVPVPLRLIEVYGDGVPFAEFEPGRRYFASRGR